MNDLIKENANLKKEIKSLKKTTLSNELKIDKLLNINNSLIYQLKNHSVLFKNFSASNINKINFDLKRSSKSVKLVYNKKRLNNELNIIKESIPNKKNSYNNLIKIRNNNTDDSNTSDKENTYSSNIQNDIQNKIYSKIDDLLDENNKIKEFLKANNNNTSSTSTTSLNKINNICTLCESKENKINDLYKKIEKLNLLIKNIEYSLTYDLNLD